MGRKGSRNRPVSHSDKISPFSNGIQTWQESKAAAGELDPVQDGHEKSLKNTKKAVLLGLIRMECCLLMCCKP